MEHKTPNSVVTISDVQKEISKEIKTKISAYNKVGFYDLDYRKIEPPSCILELNNLVYNPEDDPLTEQLALKASFVAHCIVKSRFITSRLKAEELAITTASVINKNRWGLPVAPAELIALDYNTFTPELERFETWSVEFTQIMHLSPSVFTVNDFKAVDVLASFTPKVGADHEQEYK